MSSARVVATLKKWQHYNILQQTFQAIRAKVAQRQIELSFSSLGKWSECASLFDEFSFLCSAQDYVATAEKLLREAEHTILSECGARRPVKAPSFHSPVDQQRPVVVSQVL